MTAEPGRCRFWTPTRLLVCSRFEAFEGAACSLYVWLMLPVC